MGAKTKMLRAAAEISSGLNDDSRFLYRYRRFFSRDNSITCPEKLLAPKRFYCDGPIIVRCVGKHRAHQTLTEKGMPASVLRLRWNEGWNIK